MTLEVWAAGIVALLGVFVWSVIIDMITDAWKRWRRR